MAQVSRGTVRATRLSMVLQGRGAHSLHRNHRLTERRMTRVLLVVHRTTRMTLSRANAATHSRERRVFSARQRRYDYDERS